MFCVLLLFVGFVGLQAGTPGCRCSILTPSKVEVDVSGTYFASCPTCDCEKQQQDCAKQCLDDYSIPRVKSAEDNWKASACGREHRVIAAPGEPMYVGSSVVNVDNCSSETSYNPLESHTVCCSFGSFGLYKFDYSCKWH